MNQAEPFDPTPDPELKQWLLAQLDASDHAGFARRVMAQLSAPTFWDVLATWARPGLAAAIAALTMLGFWAAWQDLHPTAAAVEAAQFETLPARNSDDVMAMVLGGRP